MPSSAKPDQAQPEALRFSQLKKKNFRGFSPLVLTIERPLQIYQEAQDSPKGGFQNLESNFFPYLFLLSHRTWEGTLISRKKISDFSKGQGTNMLSESALLGTLLYIMQHDRRQQCSCMACPSFSHPLLEFSCGSACEPH